MAGHDPWDVAAPKHDPRQPLPKLDSKQWRALAVTLVEGFGKAGRVALDALEAPFEPNYLASPTASQAEQYEHYKRIIEARGYTLAPDSPTVLAIRGMSSDGTLHPTTSAAHYDDTLVVLTRDEKGDAHVTTFAGSTHPGQNSSTASPDVTGDRRGDVGMIEPGEYKIDPRGEHAGAAAWDVKTESNSGEIPGVRDTDHDGNFTPAERTASEGRGDTLTGVLIHQGGEDNPWSVGCINLSQKEDVYPEFIEAVGGENASMTLIIIDVNRS